MALQPANKILVVGPSWVGDMVMAQSLFIALKQANSEVLIDVLAPAWTAALIDRMPQINKLHFAPFEHGKLSLLARWQLGKSLRHERYDQAIILPNSLKSALVPAFAKIPQRTGFVGEQRWGWLTDARRLNKSVLPMTVQRFLALGSNRDTPPTELDAIAIPKLEVNAEQAQNVRRKLGLVQDTPVLVLCPGAEFGASKQWPVAHYAEVARHYLAQGWQVWLLGSEKDKTVCDEIDGLCNHQLHILAGQTSLPEAVDLMWFADKVVANDSGLMHIAAALQKPLVAIYGSTDPGHTPPLSPNHAIAQIEIECSPCFERTCPLSHHRCMRDLLPEKVLAFSESQT